MLAVWLTLAMIGALVGCNSVRDRQVQADHAMADYLVALVKTRLKDPESVRFQELTLFSKHSRLVFTLCGELNAKNAYGGYVGYKLFYSSVHIDPMTNKIDHETIYTAMDADREPDDESGYYYEREHKSFLQHYADNCKGTAWPVAKEMN